MFRNNLRQSKDFMYFLKCLKNPLLHLQSEAEFNSLGAHVSSRGPAGLYSSFSPHIGTVICYIYFIFFVDLVEILL